MCVRRIRSDASDNGNAMTQCSEVVCNCDSCKRTFPFPGNEERRTDLCDECADVADVEWGGEAQEEEVNGF